MTVFILGRLFKKMEMPKDCVLSLKIYRGREQD